MNFCANYRLIDTSFHQLHEFDECRFDVSVGDCVWYLRAENLDARNKWVESIENYKVRSVSVSFTSRLLTHTLVGEYLPSHPDSYTHSGWGIQSTTLINNTSTTPS